MQHERPVLILSENLDYHGIAIKWGLSEQGVPHTWWERSSFPAIERLSCWLSSLGTTVGASATPLTLSYGEYRSVWNRRGQMPTTSQDLSGTDRVVARNETTLCLGGITAVLSRQNPECLMVNGFEHAKSADFKIHQLDVARRAGFMIPDTLVSNHPEHVRSFCVTHGGRIVAKQHFPFAWRTRDGKLLTTGTTAVSLDQLSSDESIAASPMIYQERLEIASEYRIIAFGRTIFGIDQIRATPADQDGFVDIRYAASSSRPIDVPQALADACFRYMGLMNITYAALDVAVRPDGEYVFIEANEAGQFLFLEEQCPTIPVLDAFCQFLASGDVDFKFKSGSGISLRRFEQSAEALSFHARHGLHMSMSERLSPFELAE